MNLTKNLLPEIEKIYLFVKRPFESKYQLPITRREKLGIQNLKNTKSFSDYLSKIDDVYENSEDYNLTKEKESVKSVWWHDSRYGSK